MGSDILSEIVRHKKEEIALAKKQVSESEIRRQAHASDKRRSFIDSLTQPGPHGVNIIAEIKRASPSKGLIRADFRPADHARDYEIGGATCLSVLTDAPYFQGHEDYAQSSRPRAQKARTADPPIASTAFR